MTLRSVRERVLQTCAFEFGGLCLAVPLYAAIFGESASRSLMLILAISAVVLLWSPLHNCLFDLAEWRNTGRVASERPHRLRLLQAVSLETSSVVMTLPLVMTLGGHGFQGALAIDFGLTALYVAYGYAFHLGYDWLRPVGTELARAR